VVSTADRATKAAGSGSESNQVFAGFCPLESSDSVELRGLDCVHYFAAIKPVRPTGNSGLLGIPGSVSRSPTEIQRTWLKLLGRELVVVVLKCPAQRGFRSIRFRPVSGTSSVEVSIIMYRESHRQPYIRIEFALLRSRNSQWVNFPRVKGPCRIQPPLVSSHTDDRKLVVLGNLGVHPTGKSR